MLCLASAAKVLPKSSRDRALASRRDKILKAIAFMIAGVESAIAFYSLCLYYLVCTIRETARFQIVRLITKSIDSNMNTVRKRIDEIPPMSEERAKELKSMSDKDIDYSDIPPLGEEFFKKAKLAQRKPKTEQISIRIDTEVLEWFRNHATGKGYQTLINDVLRTYVTHH